MRKFTVSEFTKSIKLLIEGAYSDTIAVTGEVSNFSRASSGHIYFSLKDKSAQLRAAFFRNYAAGASTFIPKNGDRVEAIGNLSLYEPDGSYQLIVKKVVYDSEGDFWKKFEETKRKLEAEGLFDEARKRPFVKYPQRIALVTSDSGAALKDFIVTARSASAKFSVEIWHVPVQGVDSAQKIAATVRKAGSMSERYDALVLMRGGGSLEDLSVFNSEDIVRAVASSKVPTVSAIGHERDITVVDFASDSRAATPTAAAVFLSAAYKEAGALYDALYERQLSRMVRIIQDAYQRVDIFELRLRNVSPQALMKSFAARLNMASERLVFRIDAAVSVLHLRLDRASRTIAARTPKNMLESARLRTLHAERALVSAMRVRLERYEKRIQRSHEKIILLNPENILERGYALVYKDGAVVTSASSVQIEEKIEIKMKDGYIYSFVNGIKLEVNNG